MKIISLGLTNIDIYRNEKREVALYDHSSLKCIIKFRKKNNVFFLTSFYATYETVVLESDIVSSLKLWNFAGCK